MKLVDCFLTIPGIFLVFTLFSCTSENESNMNDYAGKYTVTVVDQYGYLMPVTKAISTLPSGSKVSGTGYYASGDNCTLSYSPAFGYNSMCSWNWHDGTSIRTAQSTSAIIRRDYTVTITETQIPKSYALTLVASPSLGGRASGGGAYNAGTSVNLSANANSGFIFDGWYNGSTKLSGSPSYSYSMPSSNSVLTANFKASTPQLYTVTCMIEYRFGGGEFPAYRCVVGGGLEKNISYPESSSYSFNNVSGGTNVSCGIYRGGQANFKGWYVNGLYHSKNIDLSLTVTGNSTIVAKW